ncbi:MAG: hypothetical protein JWM16_3219 [Verrucomicrobiales bacterium]|nr:hypothetical protein [Verrucomicrobiales bacterium]
MTAFGSIEDAYGAVKVSEESVGVTSYSAHGDGKTFVNSSMPWKPHQDWFVFVENQNRVWFFDGESKLRMHQHIVFSETKSTGAWYTDQNLPCPIPQPVMDRLPEPARLKINRRLSSEMLKP